MLPRLFIFFLRKTRHYFHKGLACWVPYLGYKLLGLISNAIPQLCLKATCHLTKCDVLNDVKLFPRTEDFEFTESTAWITELPLLVIQLGDNCIQNFHLGTYIVGYTVGNLVLRRRVSGAVKRDFRTYIRRYTSPNENFEYVIPILMRY